MRRKEILRKALPVVVWLSFVIIGICIFLYGGNAKGMAGAGNVQASEDSEKEYFTTVAKGRGYRFDYANDTKVLYFIHSQGHQYGITPLYNADGTLQVYEESEANGTE